jgi:hypothetical protein
VLIRQHRTSSPVSAAQDRLALSLLLFGSDGVLLTRETVVVKLPSASNPASTVKEAEALPPTGIAEKSH